MTDEHARSWTRLLDQIEHRIIGLAATGQWPLVLDAMRLSRKVYDSRMGEIRRHLAAKLADHPKARTQARSRA